jgi:UDP-N-acetylglucosamine 4,6-dehydratase
MITGNVLVTGGTGTLGRAIVARAVREHWPCSITIYSRDEMKQQAMRQRYPQCRYVLGDVADYDTLERVMVGHQTVLHLAAFKHIPAGETNVQAVLSTNVTGSHNAAKAAIRTGVERVLGISTDKACQPVNIYGASKMVMERIFQEYDRHNLTAFHLCRYGNVLSSTGSVIPLWHKQYATGERLTVTDPAMTRFWLTADEAVNTALLALVEPHGTVIIPKLPSMAMGAFAKALFPIAQCRDIGLRPGEKRHEDLLSESEGAYALEFSEPWSYFRLSPSWSEPVAQPLGRYTSEMARRLTADELKAKIL